jgi:hypothetical protein
MKRGGPIRIAAYAFSNLLVAEIFLLVSLSCIFFGQGEGISGDHQGAHQKRKRGAQIILYFYSFLISDKIVRGINKDKIMNVQDVPCEIFSSSKVERKIIYLK